MTIQEVESTMNSWGFIKIQDSEDTLIFHMDQYKTYASSITDIRLYKKYINEYTIKTLIEKIMNDTFLAGCEYRRKITLENFNKII